jgi:O-antigen ligase
MTAVDPIITSVSSEPAAGAVPRPAGPRRRLMRAPVDQDPLDASLILLGVAVFTNVWYWQLMIPALSPLRLGILSIVGAAIAFAASPYRFDVFQDRWKRPVQLILFIGVLACLGGPFAIVRGPALNFVIYLFIPTVTFTLLVAARVRSQKSLFFLLDCMIYGGLLYGYTLITARYDAYGKPYGMPFYDANDGALVCLVTACLSLARVGTATSFARRALYAAIALFYLAVVVKSTSRGAFLALVVVVVVLLLFSTTTTVFARVRVIVVGLGLMLMVGNSNYWTVMKTILEPEKDYNWAGNSDTGRVEIWKRGLTFMLEDPILGSGAMNYQNKQGRSAWAKKMTAEGKGARWQVAHNGFLEIGVELGIPGLLTFLAILGITLKQLLVVRRSKLTPLPIRQQAEFMAAAIVAYCAGTVFLSSQYWAFVYVLIALASCAVSIALREARQQQATGSSPHPSRVPLRRAAGGRTLGVGAMAFARPRQ